MVIELNEFSSISNMQDIKNRLNTLKNTCEETRNKIIADIKMAENKTREYEEDTWNDEIGEKINDVNNNVITLGIKNIEKSLEEGNYIVLINKIDECMKSIDDTIREKRKLEELKSKEGMEYSLDHIRQLPIKENSFKDRINKTNKLLNQLSEIKLE